MKIFFLLFIYIGTLKALTQTQIYSFADLEVLEREGNFSEFLIHARDILPRKRNSVWQEMVSHMAVGFTKFHLNRPQVLSKDFKNLESYATWPSLQKDEFFQKKRGDLAIKFWGDCFRHHYRSAKKCASGVLNFWNISSKDFDLGIQLGEILFANKVNFEGIHWPLYAEGIKSKFAEFYCKKADVFDALTWKLSTLLRQELPLKKLRSAILDLSHASCWPHIVPNLKRRLHSGNRSVRNISYKLLNVLDGLTVSERDLFHTLYILNGPNNGDILNESWSTIEGLGRDFARRNEVFSSLKKIDPLPGDLFVIFNGNRREVLLNLLAKNFPEYMDYYARTCLDYLYGRKEFAQGNPTIHCRKLFKLSQGTKWLDAALLKSYKKLPNYNKKRPSNN